MMAASTVAIAATIEPTSCSPPDAGGARPSPNTAGT